MAGFLTELDVSLKECLRCKEEKLLDRFARRGEKRVSVCKDCVNDIFKKKYKDNPEPYKIKAQLQRDKNPERNKKSTAEWRKKNRDRFSDKSRVWREANPDYCRKWRKEHPDNVRAIAVKSRKRRAETIIGRLTERMRLAIRKSCISGKDGRSWESLVGYKASDLKTHLEKNFLPGMTWGNRSEWHIDHIIPVTAFNFISVHDIDFKRCWSLNNLQPLWMKDNIRKHNRLNSPFQPAFSLVA